jgi:type IV secretory pathway TraG/TraD family ATPase VirD4
VLLFDPTNAKSAAYNPLLEVRRGEWEVRDVQNVADVLVDPEGSLERRNHWESVIRPAILTPKPGDRRPKFEHDDVIAISDSWRGRIR